jgi:hypothetical protein
VYDSLTRELSEGICREIVFLDTPGMSIESEAAVAFMRKVCCGVKFESSNQTMELVDRKKEELTEADIEEATAKLVLDDDNKADFVVWAVNPQSLVEDRGGIGPFRWATVVEEDPHKAALFNLMASALDNGNEKCGYVKVRADLLQA